MREMTERVNGYKGLPELRDENLGLRAAFFVLDVVCPEDSAWFETPGEVRRKLKMGKRNKRRLAWVRAQMAMNLSKIERESVSLYYFDDLTFRQASVRMGVDHTTVCRAVRRGVDKLREAARKTHGL